MFCKFCGKESKSGSKFCTNCGALLEETHAEQAAAPATIENAPKAKKFCGTAIAGFVLALVGFIIFALPCGIIGVILSSISFAKIKAKNLKGKGLAIAGLVIGILDIVFGFINFLI